MKPEIDQILRMSAAQLGGLLPHLPDHYSQGQVALTAAMLFLSADEYERGAQIRSVENADMRALFAKLAPEVRDKELQRALLDAAVTADSSLAISALNESNYALRRLLIRLHVHVEDAPDANAKVWAVLKAMADRRFVLPPPM